MFVTTASIMTIKYGVTAQARQDGSTNLWAPPFPTLRDLLGNGTADDASHYLSGSCPDLDLPAPRLEVRESPGRGYGLFAVDFIPAYSRIFEDFALLSLASGDDIPQLWPKYNLLPPEDKLAFDQLNPPANQVRKESDMADRLRLKGYSGEDAEDMARVASIFLGNSFNVGPRKQWLHVLFPLTARINHSCTPNAHGHYRQSAGAQYAYALRDIRPGEEIEIAYFDLTLPLERRQARTASWSFTCHCPACSEEPSSDYHLRLATVRKWQHGYVNLQQSSSQASGLPQQIQNAISAAKSDKTPWLRTALPNLYESYITALINNQRNKREVLDAFEELILWETRIHGSDWPEILEPLNRSPKLHAIYKSG